MLQLGGNGGMGMLKSITLENYKCFKDRTTIDIAPLTVLCGVNSSGKSSILKSLLMLKQSSQNHNSKGEVTYNDKYVNNGNFKSIAFNASKCVTICNKFEIKSNSKSDRDMYKELYRMILGRVVKASNLTGYRRYYYINSPFEVFYNIEIKNKKIFKYYISISCKQIENPIEITLLSKSNDITNKYYVNIKNLVIRNTLYNIINNENIEATCYFEGINVTNLYADNPPRDIDIQPVFNFITTIFKNISSQFQYGIEHIAPLRYAPSRFYIADSSYSTVGISGENAIPLLNEVAERTAFNVLAPENNILNKSASNYKINEVVNSWLNYVDMGKYSINKSDDEIIKLLVGNQSIVDVGFGVSQILPIIIEGAVMPQYQTLLLEQPEIHLHPKAQMKIADYMLSLAISNKNVIVETHSDHIINRIVRRCLENPNLIDKVSIIFLSKNQDGAAKIEPIRIDEHLGIDEAPKDFFDQYSSETDIIIKRGYENMLKDSNKNV